MSLESSLSGLRAGIRRKASIFFPPLNLWYTKKQIDREERVSEYTSQLENDLEAFEDDLKDLISKSEEAHKSEIERGRGLDSKGATYVGNTGVVLSILSLIPIFSIGLGFEDGGILTSWPTMVVLGVFGYSVLTLLFSAYYSTKALKMRPYSVYLTADSIRKEIEESGKDDKEMLCDLLTAKKRNEEHNLEKNNYISVAESLSLNGLIGLGVGTGLTVLLSLPINQWLQMAQCLLH